MVSGSLNRVITQLRLILPTVDLETATQRTITQTLEQQLGFSVEEHKNLIKQTIDDFLLQQVGDDDGNDEEQQQEDAVEDNDGEEPPAKKYKPASDDSPVPRTEHGFELSSKRFLQVRVFNKRPLVDIRGYYDKDGALAPGQKGLSMTSDQWKSLVQHLEDINQAAGEQNDTFFIELGAQKRASVSSFKGKMMIDLREYYEKDGKKLPGKKGISLPPDQWVRLCAVHEVVTAELEAHGGGSGSGPSTAAAAGKGGGVNREAAASEAHPDAAGGDVSITLSSNRRADISTFKGTRYANIREYYEKDGQQLPGKKGISLTKPQFEVVCEKRAEINTALADKNTAFEVDLSNRRKLTISTFKGKYYVDMREYYEKEGELKPGAKGISLVEDQWNALVGGMDALRAAL